MTETSSRILFGHKVENNEPYNVKIYQAYDGIGRWKELKLLI